MDRILRQYLEKLKNEHRKLDSRGVMQVSKFIELDLTDVFIPLLLKREVKSDTGRLPRFEPNLKDSTSSDNLDKSSYFPFEPTELRAGKDIKLGDLFQWNRHWAILGDPGAGKTTLLKHQALTAAQNFLDGTDDYLPVYITLRYFAEVCQKNADWMPENALLAYLIEDGLKELGFSDLAERQNLVNLIRKASHQGKLLLLLDGMDEERDRESKRKTGLAIARVLRGHPENRCLVTSRVVGFDATALIDHFEIATLQDFSDEQRNNYLRQWLLAVEKAEDIVVDQATMDRATRKSEELIQQLDDVSGLAALAANPLLCTIIGLIYHQGGALPRQRVELYKLCVDTFIFNWEMTKRRKGLSIEAGLNPEETQAVLEPIALYFQEDCPENRASRNQILAIMTNFLAKDAGLSEELARRKATDQLNLIREVAGLFVDRGDEEYGFFHLTFQEYLAARAITRKRREIQNYVHTYAFDPRWREVLKLAAGHQGLKSAEDGSEFIEIVLNAPHLYTPEMEYSFRLAFACMREARVEPITQQQMIARWVELYLTQPGLRGFLLKLITRPGRALQVTKKTLQPLCQAIVDPNTSVRQAVVSALSSFAPAPETFEALLNASVDADAEVRERAVWALSSFAPASEALEALLNAAVDMDEDVRQAACMGIAKFAPDPKAFEVLLKIAKNAEGQWDSWCAFLSLNGFGPSLEVLNALLKAFIRSEWNRSMFTDLVEEMIPKAGGFLNLLDEEDADVRQGAALALGSFAPAPEALEALLKAILDEVPEVRQEAVSALGSFAPAPEALEALLKAILDEAPEVRQEAVSALGSFAPAPEVLEALLKAILDEAPEVRQAAALALGSFAPAPEVLEALLKAILDEAPEVRQGVVSALGSFVPAPEVLEALLKAILDEAPEVRQAAALALDSFAPDPEVLEALLKAILDEAPEVRQGAALALGRFAPDPEVLEALLKAILDEAPEVRRGAVSALGGFGPVPEVLEALSKAALDKELRVRLQTVWSLGSFAPAPEALEVLLRAVIDTEINTRLHVIDVLDKFELGPNSINVLLKALSYNYRNIRSWAVTNLVKFASYAELINILRRALTDEETSEGAAEAIERFEMGAPL